MATEYKLFLFPENDLVIYEIGAGNGTLMVDVLNYLREMEPKVYERTRYQTIEISDPLATIQEESIATDTDHKSRVKINRSSIFNWTENTQEPCFIIACEVLV